MKIYRFIVIDITLDRIIEEDSYEYQGSLIYCGPSGGGGSSNTTSEASIAPELRPLFGNTAGMIEGFQNSLASGDPNATPAYQNTFFDPFFRSQTQQIPDLTSGAEDLRRFQMQRALGGIYTQPDVNALNQIDMLTGGPLGMSPATQSAMAAIRAPVMNDLALAGLGNSDAVASNQAAAFAPILAQEMQMRASLAPVQAQIGETLVNRQSRLIGESFGTEEQARAIEEARGQATLADLLRRQNLGQTYSTGLLGGFPAAGGSTSSTRSSGGGK